VKRHDSLIPLTHDHHHALAQARRLRISAARPQQERTAQAREFIDFFESDTLVHFREEEELVFPLVIDDPEAETALARLMLEHLRIHAGVHKLRDELESDAVRGNTLASIAEQLETHVRFEEKTIFPLIEQIAVDELSDVQLSPRDRVHH
jgi:iron-sulfur cluster repair protein YtfE (RIC family)